MTSKTLMVDPSLCTGCRTCEMACSLHHEGRCSPTLSRTRVIKFESRGMNLPTVCAQCSKPACVQACAQMAIGPDPLTGAVVVNEALCSGCRSCLMACPHGQMGFNEKKGVAFKCDLCGGDPQCARFCPSGAISFVSIDDFLMARRRALASRATGEV